MNSLYILIGVIFLVIVFYPKIIISENQIYSPISDGKKLSTPRMYDFYIPQLTNEQTPLSQDKFNNQMNANTLTRNTYLNDDNVDIIRDELNSIDKKYPKYILKDTLSGNTVGTSELHPTSGSEDSPYKSFLDDNVSQYPKYYTSDIKNELTNVGKFFDKANKYSDSTRPSGSAYVDDNCYIDANNDITCLKNTRLQNIPPKNTDIQSLCEYSGNPSLIKNGSTKNIVLQESTPIRKVVFISFRVFFKKTSFRPFANIIIKPIHMFLNII